MLVFPERRTERRVAHRGIDVYKMTIKDFEQRAKFQNGYDREFDEWKIIDIHEIPDRMQSYHEVDFYCCNSKKVYLLRLCNRDVESYEIAHSDKDKKMGFPPYLIAELPLTKIDNDLIKQVLSKFEL